MATLSIVHPWLVCRSGRRCWQAFSSRSLADVSSCFVQQEQSSITSALRFDIAQGSIRHCWLSKPCYHDRLAILSQTAICVACYSRAAVNFSGCSSHVRAIFHATMEAPLLPGRTQLKMRTVLLSRILKALSIVLCHAPLLFGHGMGLYCQSRRLIQPRPPCIPLLLRACTMSRRASSFITEDLACLLTATVDCLRLCRRLQWA
jgi:hypothetical protein